MLLVDADVTHPHPLVDILLAPLAAESYRRQRDRGLTPAQITDALTRLAHAVM